MAKQSGLHQIRGKVGEHSYYRQTGVESGLIRSINQGLSNRVKTAAEYANTRLNNAEFGQACRIAGVLGQLVIPKYRPMVLPFSQSKMARILIDFIKTTSGTWGQRNLVTTDVGIVLEAINATHKNNPDDWGLSFDIDDNDKFVISGESTVFTSKLASIGAAGVDFVVLACRPWIGTYSSSDNKYAQSFARANIYEGNITPPTDTLRIDFEFRAAPPTGWPAISMDFFVVVILPYREVDRTPYTLQEHCTFKAIGVPGAE